MRDPEDETRGVGIPIAVDLPLPELNGGFDHRGSARQAARVELVPQLLIDRIAGDEQLGQDEASSRPWAAPWAIVGGQLCAASPMMTARPRFHGASTMCFVNHV